jgi:Mrp family chromosome partitioning ATPase
VSDPNAVRLVESVPQPAVGQPLQRAVLGSEHYLAEEFRFLAAKVAGLASERFTTVGIVSTGPSEGKTTVALGLTAALSRLSGHRALLLEADLRQPSVERYLGLPRTGGLSEFLAGHTQSVPVRTITPPGFAVLAAGRERLERPELLGSGRMASLIGVCQLSYGFIVVDCPPLDAVADAVALQDLIDGFLLVIRARCSPRAAIERAVSRLKQDRVRGVVFNDQPVILPIGYGHGYDYRDERMRYLESENRDQPAPKRLTFFSSVPNFRTSGSAARRSARRNR